MSNTFVWFPRKMVKKKEEEKRRSCLLKQNVRFRRMVTCIKIDDQAVHELPHGRHCKTTDFTCFTFFPV